MHSSAEYIWLKLFGQSAFPNHLGADADGAASFRWIHADDVNEHTKLCVMEMYESEVIMVHYDHYNLVSIPAMRRDRNSSKGKSDYGGFIKGNSLQLDFTLYNSNLHTL